MNNGLKAFNEHMERKTILDKGGRIKCPNCKDGYIAKLTDDIYLCDKCKYGIIGRFSLDEAKP